MGALFGEVFDFIMAMANFTFSNMLYNTRNYDSPTQGRRPKPTPKSAQSSL